MDNTAARKLLIDCFRAAIAAVDPEEAVARSLGPVEGRVVVLALGKGAPAMARGAARALDRDRLEGIVVSNHKDEIPGGLELLLGSHPVPDAASHHAGKSLLDLASSLGADDTAVVLVSGGGSALVEVPVPGVTMEDLASTNQALLRSGADIVATNIVRRRLSLIKGGGLAAAIAPAQLVTLVVSDVVGDDPATIASGPTVARHDLPDAAAGVVRDLGLGSELPAAVMAALSRSGEKCPEPPEQRFEIVAGGATAAHAAAAEAEQRGVPANVLDTTMMGDAGLTAGEVLERARFGMSVFVGETTVQVTGNGVGGRNHEAALVAATLIEGRSDVWFLAAGTDGVDGMTQAAGAVVDGGTVERAEAMGLDANRALDRNDSGTFFAELGEQIVTGATGTNVGDLWLVLRD